MRTTDSLYRLGDLYGHPIEAADAHAMQLVDELTDDATIALARVSERSDTVSRSELAIRRQLTFDAGSIRFEDALGPHLADCNFIEIPECGRLG